MDNTNQPRILLVEDDMNLGFVIQDTLKDQGYKVHLSKDGKEGLMQFNKETYDLCLLDVMMPKKDGFSLAEDIRKINQNIPIVFLTAKGMAEDKVKGFTLGADDYITKPFSSEELVLRINLLRRGAHQQPHQHLREFEFGGNRVNFEKHEAKGVNGSFNLTKKEVLLLKLLIEHKNEVVSREKILQTVWGYSVYPSTRTIDNFILSFRKYFEPDPKNPKHFLAIRGVGYIFEC